MSRNGSSSSHGTKEPQPTVQKIEFKDCEKIRIPSLITPTAGEKMNVEMGYDEAMMPTMLCDPAKSTATKMGNLSGESGMKDTFLH